MAIPILTVRAPFATGILRWGFTQLSRLTQPPPYLIGRRIQIHSAATIKVRPDGSLFGGAEERELFRTLVKLEAAGVLPEPLTQCVSTIIQDVSGLLGSVRLDRVLQLKGDKWKDSTGEVQKPCPWTSPAFPFIWVFSDPQPFEQLRRYRGCTGFWYLKTSD